jgi:hypothetical protein
MFFMVTTLVAFTISCDDNFEPTRQFAKNDAEFSATPSVSTVAVSASDSLKEVISFNWNDPQYAIGLGESKFTIKVGASGSNFSSFLSKEFSGVLTGALLGKELNGMAVRFGGVIGQPITLDVMVVAAQSNNNEPKNSDVVKITVTPYGDLGLSTSSPTVVLTLEDANETAVMLNWTTAFNGFKAVKTYEIQYAKAATNFAGPETEVMTKFTKSFTHKELNNIAQGYGIAPDTEGFVEFRVKATNEVGTVLYSNVIALSVVPYVNLTPIFAMGDGLQGWGPWPDKRVALWTTQFKKYETIAHITNGKAFRFFEQSDWGPTSYNYPYFTTVDPLFENAGDDDLNLRFVGTTGWYKVDVDLLAKTVTAVTTDEPVLYMTGGGLNGWSWDPGVPITLTYLSEGVFEATATFTSGGIFRFFAQPNWGPTSYNYEYFTEVDASFELNAGDGDKNLKYLGATEERTIRVNMFTKEVTLE